ncbi:MAG: glycan-binding surface protein [Mediterranea sp.]|nr:glycan-binding surface protein [Mediterranea sp.]
MKRRSIYKDAARLLLLGLVVCFGLAACEEYPDAYKTTGGKPEISYVRVPDVASADSLLVEAYLGNTICLVGNNLRSIHELYFNDQQAILNTSFITDHTLIVVVPKGIPEKVDNKIYLITTSNETVEYDFTTKVPDPVVNSISCEYVADGDIATLYGDYFVDDPNVPLTITMAGNLPVAEIVGIEKTQIKFKVPAGTQKGFINVKTIYGTGRSHFQFRDDRGMILDWDNLDASGGWRDGSKNGWGENGISGRYTKFKGSIDNGDWNEDGFSFNLWGSSNGRPEGDLFDTSDLTSLQLKFEINILDPWSCNAMQIIFTPWSTSGTNGYYDDTTIGRALWAPWTNGGSYQTDGWTTISVPLSDFKYTHTGGSANIPEAGNYGGLSFFVWSGGINGQPCTTEMWIDNIRVVPIE